MNFEFASQEIWKRDNNDYLYPPVKTITYDIDEECFSILFEFKSLAEKGIKLESIFWTEIEPPVLPQSLLEEYVA